MSHHRLPSHNSSSRLTKEPTKEVRENVSMPPPVAKPEYISEQVQTREVKDMREIIANEYELKLEQRVLEIKIEEQRKIREEVDSELRIEYLAQLK